MKYIIEKPENTEIFTEPVWPKPEELQKALVTRFGELMIETADHEIIKRARGLITRRTLKNQKKKLDGLMTTC